MRGTGLDGDCAAWLQRYRFQAMMKSREGGYDGLVVAKRGKGLKGDFHSGKLEVGGKFNRESYT